MFSTRLDMVIDGQCWCRWRNYISTINPVSLRVSILGCVAPTRRLATASLEVVAVSGGRDRGGLDGGLLRGSPPLEHYRECDEGRTSNGGNYPRYDE